MSYNLFLMSMKESENAMKWAKNEGNVLVGVK